MADINSGLKIETFQDKEGSKELIIYPREFSITWGNDKRYWEWVWILIESKDFKVVEIPRLLNVCWLEVDVKFDMSRLTTGVKYVAGFVVMMKDPIKGWENSPVNLRLDLPDDTSQSCNADFSTLPRNEWKTLTVGEFVATAKGEGSFSLREIKKQYWKSGLIIKSAFILPNYN